MTAFLEKLDAWTRKFLRFLVIATFSVLGILMILNVAMRLSNDFTGFLARKGFADAAAFLKSTLPTGSFHWFDEIVELCFAYLVFYGAAALWAAKEHFCVGDWISPRLPGVKLRNLYKLLVSVVCAAFMAVFFRFSLSLTMRTTEMTTVFQMPKSILYSCMPISSFVMLIYSLADIYRQAKRVAGFEEKTEEPEEDGKAISL
ncbi:MAG: TRAP transporter small permease [Synergistaceae bacterium]|jgi:TRAP-type C4-dicarboxylate transport system permease small subunit|nr:TRAP transporter small permease [Synergistaceae bacterium]